jgi:RNA polymerase sigma-70 factor (ECF subfamily)
VSDITVPAAGDAHLDDVVAVSEADDRTQAALAEWYSASRPRLVAVMVAVTGSRREAEEVADEAIVRALERWGTAAAEEASLGWLITVGRNAHRRSQRRLGLFRRAAPTQLPPETADPPDLSSEVLLAVAALPDRQREAIGLRYLVGLPVGEIAEVMGVTAGTVSRTLFDARRKLAQVLGEPLAADPTIEEPT